MTTDKTRVQKFLQNGYADWIVQQRRAGKSISEATQRQFCNHLGVSDTSFSRWLDGKPPNLENIDRLAAWYGPEIYELYGISERMPKDALLKDILRKWHKLPEERRRYYLEQIMKEVEEQEKLMSGKDHDEQQLSLA